MLDIRQGQVVQAAGGDRALYEPIQSALTRSVDPVQVVDDLLRFAPFPVFYLADLDAIMGKPAQCRLIVELCHDHPDVEFWVDAGPLPKPEETLPDNFRPVLGTEFACDWTHHDDRVILSLDFNREGLRGGTRIWAKPDSWPARVIVMCLHRVGSMEGPDFELLEQIRTLRPDCRLAAAGGVRNADDAHRLLDAGMDALVASVLHQGHISTEEVQRTG
ncbi:MAG: HisA/HisF-related TIM barrel protein [Gammaproteobacteria bacterium]|nr:HisA/HisF-related TIM barrel protein [Gammaproteobacteria bacterium]